MTGSFRIETLVSSSRPRSPLRLTRLPMTRLLLAAALVAAFFLSPSPTAADARFTRLSEPGIVAILRHAFAPGTGDPATFALDDCTTQRNLDAQGRNRRERSGRRSAPPARPSTGSSPANGAAAATRPDSSTSVRSRTCPR